MGEGRDALIDCLGKRLKFGAVGKFEVFVVGKVEFEFEKTGQMKQLVAQCGKFGGETATQLIDGQLMSGFIGRGDEVGNGFGLREVEFAVEKSTLGIFARVGHAASFFNK